MAEKQEELKKAKELDKTVSEAEAILLKIVNEIRENGDCIITVEEPINTICFAIEGLKECLEKDVELLEQIKTVMDTSDAELENEEIIRLRAENQKYKTALEEVDEKMYCVLEDLKDYSTNKNDKELDWIIQQIEDIKALEV